METVAQIAETKGMIMGSYHVAEASTIEDTP